MFADPVAGTVAAGTNVSLTCGTEALPSVIRLTVRPMPEAQSMTPITIDKAMTIKVPINPE